MSIDVLPCSSALIQQHSQPHHRLPSSRRRRSSASASALNARYEAMYVQNATAFAVIAQLHRWCCQLLWLTILCVVGCCGELQHSKSKTLHEVRRSLGNSRRGKSVTDLEMQLLRHLTSPQTAVLRPLSTAHSRKRRCYLSRPPSPQLFDIREEVEAEEREGTPLDVE